MGTCKIVDYSEEWKDLLRIYMRKTFPTYSDAYIDYSLSHSDGRVPTKIVICDNDIVGCHFYYCTKAYINGEEVETQWGHDTYLDEEYRKEIGVDFALMRKKQPSFGVGITEVNKKLNKLMKNVFLVGVYNYYTITPYIILSPIQKILHIKKNIKDINVLKVNSYLFKRVSSPEDMKIPNNGFWYKDYYNLDFVRDESFLNERFFNSGVHDYHIYTFEYSYFVARVSTYRGIPSLILSDFRYDPYDFESANNILKAVIKLANKSGLGIIIAVCGDKRIDNFFKKRIHHKTSLDFICSYKVNPESSFSLSGGDSDAEFLK